MIAIPAGVVELRDARPGSGRGRAGGATRTVALRPFEIGRTPVTRAEYDAIAAARHLRAPARRSLRTR